MEKHNANWIETHQRITQAVFKLWETTPLNRITIRAVCEEAHINRSTFYVHFDNIYSVTDEAVNAAHADLLDFCTRSAQNIKDPKTLSHAVMGFLQLVQDSSCYYRMYFNHMHDLPFESGGKIYTQLYDSLAVPYGYSHPDTTHVELNFMLASFEAATAMAVSQWVNNDFADPKEQVARVIARQPLLENLAQSRQ